MRKERLLPSQLGRAPTNRLLIGHDAQPMPCPQQTRNCSLGQSQTPVSALPRRT